MSEVFKLRRYDCFDGIRGIGVVIVIFSHLPLISNGNIYNLLWNIEHKIRIGYLLLDLFFLMSGFFITRILLSERRITGKISLKDFYIRRTLRIFPIYYITVIISFCIFRFKYSELISILTYTFNYYHPLYPTPNPLEQTWSLSVEEQFYLFWPLLIGTIPLRLSSVMTGRVIPVIAIASGVGIAILVGNDDQVLSGNIVYMSLCTRMLSLSLGGWLAVREFEGKPLTSGRCVALVIAGIAILTLELPARSYGFIYSQALYWTIALTSYAMLSVAVTSVLIFDRGLVAAGMRKFLEFRLLRFLGGISYALYLFHLPVLYYFQLNAAVMEGKKANAVFVVEAVAITLILAILSQILIERPFMSMRRHFGSGSRKQVLHSEIRQEQPLS